MEQDLILTFLEESGLNLSVLKDNMGLVRQFFEKNQIMIGITEDDKLSVVVVPTDITVELIGDNIDKKIKTFNVEDFIKI